MNTANISATLTTLLAELVDGPTGAAYMINRGDPGLLRSLDRLSASAASTVNSGGSSIAAHVDHLRYGMSLMNRWAGGESDPFTDADWSASWRKNKVSDAEWVKLRSELRDEAHRWLDALRTSRDVNTEELNGMIGSIAHLAYHVGAIRQIDRTARGPAEPG